MKIETKERRDFVIITYTLGENDIEDVYAVYKHAMEVFDDKKVIALPDTMTISDYLDDDSAAVFLEMVERELKEIKENKKNGQKQK